MSGGHWDYMQHRLTDFGEVLAREEDPVLAAVGRMLMQIADHLDVVDRVFSGDRGQEALAEPRAALRKLLPPDAPTSVVRDRAIAALDALRAELSALPVTDALAAVKAGEDERRSHHGA